MNDLAGRLERTYKQLRKSQVDFYLADKHTLKAKRYLEETILKATASGEIEGKNPKDREANAKEKFAAMYQYLEDKSDKARWAKLNLSLAQLEVDHARALIRIEEIKVGRLPDAGH